MLFDGMAAFWLCRNNEDAEIERAMGCKLKLVLMGSMASHRNRLIVIFGAAIIIICGS